MVVLLNECKKRAGVPEFVQHPGLGSVHDEPGG